MKQDKEVFTKKEEKDLVKAMIQADRHHDVRVCPVCGGKGIVRGNFYDIYGGYSTTGELTTKCRSCVGTGIIYL